MPHLTTLIPRQMFEVVRDRIAAILADELIGQDAFLGVNAFGAEVWIERFVPFDKEELPAINVSLIKGDYSNKDVRQVDGDYQYAVDVYTDAETTDTDYGDRLAAFKLQRLLGMCRAILQSPIYKTLGIAPPFLCSVKVDGFSIGNPESNQDAISLAQGRLEVSVRVPETVALQIPLLLSMSTTEVRIGVTQAGYRYVYQPGGGDFNNDFNDDFFGGNGGSEPVPPDYNADFDNDYNNQ